MAEQQWYKSIPWIRSVISIAAVLLIAFCIMVIAFGTSSSNDIALAILAGITAIFAFGQWFFPLSPSKSEQFILPNASELIPENFKMGDNSAANFPYITTPIQREYDTATQILLSGTTGANHKQGILILGEANAGKTRLAFEVLIHTLPSWPVLRWRPDSKLNEAPPNKKHLVIFIDDLQDYVAAQMKDDSGRALVSDPHTRTLRSLLETQRQLVKRVLVVATCRIEHEVQVQAGLGQLFTELEVVKLRRFNVDIYDPEAAKIIADFQRHGSTYIQDWDGTLGSLVLGLSTKNQEYLRIRNDPAATILRAMKLLSRAGILEYTEQRLRAVCSGIFGEKELLVDEKLWQGAVNFLGQEQFVTEELNGDNLTTTLVIRKDTYFDKVITDYPTPNRPHQIENDLMRLKDIFVALRDANALVTLGGSLANLKMFVEAISVYDQAIKLDSINTSAYFKKGNLLSDLKSYEDALTAYEQVIHLDPNYAFAHNNKGDTLANLGRYAEALAAFDQAILLDPRTFTIYQNKGNMLSELNRYEEALDIYNRAIQLHLNDEESYYRKANILVELKRYEEALTAYKQAIQLGYNSARIYSNMGIAFANLKRYEEALTAYEQAIQLGYNSAHVYSNMWEILTNLNRYEEALAAYEQVLRLEPNTTEGFYDKGNIYIKLGLYKEALAAYEQAIQMGFNPARIYSDMGYILANLEQYEEALAAYEQAIQQEPNNALAYNRKGDALANLKRYEEALQAYNNALALDPVSNVALTKLKNLIREMFLN